MDLAFLINELWRQQRLPLAERPRPYPAAVPVVWPVPTVPATVVKPEARS